MSKTKGVVKLVVNTDTDPTPQEPSLVENETSGIFVHSTNSSVASRLWFSQGTSLSSSFSKLEFDTDFGLKIHTENPVNVLHDASIRFGTRGSERWKIEGLNGSSGDLLPATDNSLKIGRAGFNLNSIFSRQLISDDTLALAASGATKWNIDTSGHFVPTATTQNIGSSGSYLSFVYANQLLAGTGQALYLGSNAGIYKWYIANSSNAALVPNTAGAFDLGASASRVGTLYSTSINNSGTLTTDTIDSSSGIITDVIQTRTTASSLSIKTGTSYPTRLTIDSSGNVGIGVSSPVARLQVAGNFQIGSSATATNNWHFAAEGGDGKLNLYNGNYGSGTFRATMTSDGNLGIGTSSPQQLLHVSNEIATGDIRVLLGLQSNGVQLIRNGTTDCWVRFTGAPGILDTADNFHMLFRTNATERMRISSDGNIGIGITTPVTPLHIHTTSGNTTLHLTNATTGTTISDGFSLVSEITSNDAFVIQRENANLIFRTNNTDRLRITNSGDVGIGASSPQTKLHVAGALSSTVSPATAKGTIQIDEYSITSLTQAGGLEFKSSFANSGYGSRIVGFDDGTMIFARRSNSATWSESFRVDPIGRVGIGTTTPSFPLSVLANTSNGVSFESRGRSSDHASVVLFTQNDGTQLGRIQADPSFLTIQKEGNNPLGFATNGQTRILIAGDGNVGIGNIDPQYLLDCRGAARIANNHASADGSSASFEIGYFGTGNRNAFIDFHAAGSTPSVDYNFRIIRELGVDGDAVFVNKGLGRFGFTLEEDTTPRTLEFNARGGASAAFEIAYEVGGVNGTPNDDSLLIRRSSETTTTGGLRLYNANAITSGTFTYSEIDMRGDGSLYIDIGDGLGVQSGLTLFTNGRIELSSFSGGIFVDAASGAVAPSVPNLNLGGNTSRWGTVYYTTLNPPSDIRLKKDIKDIETAKHIIQSVKPKEFTWKNNNRKTAGFIAQEFVNVLPIGVAVGSDESVSVEDSAFESWSIDPFIMVPYLTKALQEAFEEIKQLRQELTELKNK